MTLTEEDRQHLKPLLVSAIAEVEASLEPEAMQQPASVEEGMDLIASLEWARKFLSRLELESHA